jgi:hypothetical protein
VRKLGREQGYCFAYNALQNTITYATYTQLLYSLEILSERQSSAGVTTGKQRRTRVESSKERRRIRADKNRREPAWYNTLRVGGYYRRIMYGWGVFYDYEEIDARANEKMRTLACSAKKMEDKNVKERVPRMQPGIQPHGRTG